MGFRVRDLPVPFLTGAERRLAIRVMVGDIRKRIAGRAMSYYANAAHNLTLGYALGGLWALLAIRGDEDVPSLDAVERMKPVHPARAGLATSYRDRERGIVTFRSGWNKDDDWHEFWWQLQTCPGNRIVTRRRGATVHGWKHGHCLDVHVITPFASEFPKPHTVRFEQDVNSTSSFKYIPDPHARAAQYVRPERMAHGPCFVRPRLLAKVSGYNGRFMTVLTPRRKSEPPAAVRRLPAVPSSFGAEVEIGPWRDTILFAYEHDLLEAGDVAARGRWAVVRRRAETGRVVAWTLGHGRSLTVGGRALL